MTENNNPNQQPQGSGFVRPPTSRPILTYILLAIIVGVAFVQLLLRQLNYPVPEPILPWGALNYDRVLANGEYYRLFTAMFLHVDETHLLFNALALYFSGRFVETYFRTGRFGVIYLLGGLSGSVASFIFTRSVAAGASGAIFAVFGAEMVFLYQNRAIFGQAAMEQLRILVIFAVINFGIGIYTQLAPGSVVLDNWAHAGGFFAGIVLAWFIGPQYQLMYDASLKEKVRITDTTPRARMLVTPSLFALGLVLVMVYALAVLR